MASIEHLYSETKIIQVENHMKLLSAQYLVQCLDIKNVCPHTTKMDLPPREMKETIFTRHYKTMLPLLENNRKDTLHALHTSFVNTAIDNMKDNRVLNNRPPPINDEETLLSRRQMTTLSQLRSGHCKLLNSYKKRLKKSDSSSCPDCGMDPQDVPCCCLPTPITLASGGESDVPACGKPASFSVHLASSAVTLAGSVHKSRGDNVVRMWVQVKR